MRKSLLSIISLIFISGLFAVENNQPQETPGISNTPKEEETLNVSNVSKKEAKKYPSEDLAIAAYKTALEKSQLTSIMDFFKAFNIKKDPESDSMKVTIAKFDPMFQEFLKREQGIKLEYVDVCKGPKFGNSIQHVGFLLSYSDGAGFVDALLYRHKDGWYAINLNVTFNSSETELVDEAIPAMYFSR